MFSALVQGLLITVLSCAGPQTAGEAEAMPGQFEVLGMRVCMTEPSDAKPCHLRLYPVQQAEPEAEARQQEPVPLQLTVFGKRICVGPVPAPAICDIRFGVPSSQVEA